MTSTRDLIPCWLQVVIVVSSLILDWRISNWTMFKTCVRVFPQLKLVAASYGFWNSPGHVCRIALRTMRKDRRGQQRALANFSHFNVLVDDVTESWPFFWAKIWNLLKSGQVTKFQSSGKSIHFLANNPQKSLLTPPISRGLTLDMIQMIQAS